MRVVLVTISILSFVPTALDAQARPGPGVVLEELTWLEAEAVLTPETVVVIPVGAASKEHGPHLRLENLYLHHVDGSLPDEAWVGTRTTFMVYMGRPGLRDYWEQRRGFFHEDFVHFVDGLEPPPMKSGAEVSKLGGLPAPESPRAAD